MVFVKTKVLSLLGLAARGQNLVSGEFMTEKAVKSYKAVLVLVAEDASENTKKSFYNMCEFYEVPCYEFSSKEEIGHAIGRQMRASVAIINQGFADSVMKYLEER